MLSLFYFICFLRKKFFRDIFAPLNIFLLYLGEIDVEYSNTCFYHLHACLGFSILFVYERKHL